VIQIVPNILKRVAQVGFIGLAGAFVFFLLDSGQLPGFPAPVTYTLTKIYSSSDNKNHEVKIPSVLDFAGETVPLENNSVRKKLAREFLNNDYTQPSNVDLFSKYISESKIIGPILWQNGVPRDFIFLCVAESHLQNNAVSAFGASGMWQFMRTTGLNYGLEINEQVDERLNLQRSTEAACQYLKDAHDRLGSWTLAAASFNMGPDALAMAVKNQKTDNFYKLNLNAETSEYLYRILAVKQILSHPFDYGMDEEPDASSLQVDYRQLRVDTTIHSLKNFAHQQGTDLKTLKKLNPWLRGSALANKSGKTYFIAVPASV
jgi:membrane-bound lytic murein transglycosylase D